MNPQTSPKKALGVPNTPLKVWLEDMGMNFKHLGMSNNWQNWKGTSSSEPRKITALLSIESWLFNRDPYNGLSLQYPQMTVQYNPQQIP